MKLFIESMVLSAASTKRETAEDETPWASGLLRGRPAPMQMEPLRANSAITARVFMRVPLRKIGSPKGTWDSLLCRHLRSGTSIPGAFRPAPRPQGLLTRGGRNGAAGRPGARRPVAKYFANRS